MAYKAGRRAGALDHRSTCSVDVNYVMDRRGAFTQPEQPHCQGQVVVLKDFITFLVCTAVTVFVCVCCCIWQKRR